MTPEQHQQWRAMEDLVEAVRSHMRDWPELSTLIEGFESSDAMIRRALADGLDSFNNTPPRIGIYGFKGFPLRTSLVDWATSRLLESASLLYARNELTYQHQGTQVALRQTETYQQISATLRDRALRELREWKVARNAELAMGAVGGLTSEYTEVFSPLGSMTGRTFQG